MRLLLATIAIAATLAATTRRDADPTPETSPRAPSSWDVAQEVELRFEFQIEPQPDRFIYRVTVFPAVSPATVLLDIVPGPDILLHSAPFWSEVVSDSSYFDVDFEVFTDEYTWLGFEGDVSFDDGSEAAFAADLTVDLGAPSFPMAHLPFEIIDGDTIIIYADSLLVPKQGG